MRKFALIILLTSFIGILPVSSVYAQLSRKERKEWKKKKKKMEPSDFKAIVDENNALKTQLNSVKNQLSSMQERISDKDARIAELQEKVTQLEADLSAARQRAQKAQQEAAEQIAAAQAQQQQNGNYDQGVVFKVQIGSFRQKDLSAYFEKYENFAGEIREDGTQSITLGTFRDYWDADKFKKYLRDMGVEDAWIVPYKDGERVPLKEVLEGVIN